MDKHIRIKRNKRDGKFTIDYARARNRNAARFDLLRQMNLSHDLFIIVNTAIDMGQSMPRSAKLLNLTTDQGYQEAEGYLKGSGYEYCLKKTQKEFGKSLMGFSTGRTELRTVALMAVAVGKGQLSQEFFDTLGRSHDLLIGIDPIRPVATLLEDFEAGRFDSIDQDGNFAHTMVDSQWLGYFYTDWEPAGLE
ncbi:MAG: hypothetical protein RBT68_03905 [Spirochaetia bacterium]|jgi:hypothetical protein|nr:hypothetical protein [Spirochaetia bacterium]